MHIGDIVSIDNKSIRLNKSLLSPLHIQDKSTIFGLYYPATHTDTNEQYMFDHDFMFTPIPPRLWHSVARFVLLLKHEPGCIAGITNYLRDNNINIITAESTRAGHRFMYFTLTLEFEKLSDVDDKGMYHQLTSSELEKKQTALKHHIKELTENIDVNCKDYLFQSIHGNEPFGLVEGHIVHSLQYFYYKVGECGINDKFRPFMATVEQSKIVFDENDWKHLWHNLLENDIPTYGFAAASTRDLCLRVCLLDRDKLKDFRTFVFNYKFRPNSQSVSSRGLIGFVSKELHSHEYNIWSIYNSPTYNKSVNGDGSIKIVAQQVLNPNKIKSTLPTADDHLKSIFDKFKIETLYETIILSGSVTKLTRCPIFVSVRSLDPDKESYKELFYEAGIELGLLENDFVFFDSSKATNNISDAVIDTLRDCSVMIQIHNIIPKNKIISFDKKRSSVWLEAECLLAKAMGKPYTVLIHKDIKSNLRISIESDYTEYKSKLNKDDVKNAIIDVIEKKYGSIENM